MSTDDELNEELGSYGYKLDTFALKDSNYQVSRLDRYGGRPPLVFRTLIP